MKNKNKIIASILMTIGIVLITVFSIVATNFKRDYESYYHHNEYDYGYFEITTQKDIDVDNAYVNIIDQFGRKTKEKLEYEKCNGKTYIFSMYEFDYNILSLEIKDNQGNIIQLIKYTETQEQSRIKKQSIMFAFVGIGVLMVIVGFVVIVSPSIKKSIQEMDKKLNNVVGEIFNKEEHIKCEYCGSLNEKDNIKCKNCGASFQSKKK